MNADAIVLDYDRRPSALTYMARGVWPAQRHADLAPEIRARWHGHRPDRRELADFRRIAGLGRDDGRLPLLYPHTFGFRLAMAILTHPRFPVPIWGVLQIRNHLEQLQDIATDATLDFETRVMHGRVVSKGAEFDLHTTVHAAGTLAWQSDVTFFTRGRFGEPEAAAPLTRSPTEFGEPLSEWTLSDDEHVRFGNFTGDYNGIHLWDWYARRMGFGRAFYHPSRVLGQCLAHLPQQQTSDNSGNRVALDVWLKGPVPHAATVRLHAATVAEATTFALFAGDERPSIVGQLQQQAPNAP